MRLPHRLQGQKVKSQGGAGAYCGGDLAAQLVLNTIKVFYAKRCDDVPTATPLLEEWNAGGLVEY